MTSAKVLLLTGVLTMAGYCCGAEVSSAAETALAREWVRRAWADPAAPAPRPVGLRVLACHGPLLRDRRAGRPLTIAGTSYSRGLLAHAVSRIEVQFDGPGGVFSAVLGVDSNEQTQPGKGSVVFSVLVGDKAVFSSAVLREGMAGVPVRVDLAGATSLVLDVGDGGDGIACDHADWAEAKVTLADGREVWLNELPEISDPSGPPFSFVYGGQAAAELLPTWSRKEELTALDAQRQQRVTTWTDPVTRLEVRCVLVEYLDFPTLEWTLHFRNAGTQETPILERIQAIDACFQGRGQGEFRLHHAVGSPCTPGDYQPLETVLTPSAAKRIAAAGGRPTNSDLCYFNLEWSGGGVIAALGWPGQWAASFSREGNDRVRLAAGQELTHFKLLPGEEARAPLVALQFWQGGDWIRAQNTWRRWLIAHHLPRPGGTLVPTHYGSCWSATLNPSAAEEMAIIAGFEREGVKLDYYFIDAGWYTHPGGGWERTGTWTIDTERFPRGLREVADHLHERGTKFVLWFELERVTEGSWLAVNHPEWVLRSGDGWLLNLGNPEAWAWALATVDGFLTSEAIDVYREDFNIDPLACWRGADAPERQGLTEMRHIEGHLALWDELRRRHPDLLIDSCASGGRRNDLETLRRAVPLLRSDCFSPVEAQQAQTMGITLWIPYYGSGMYPADVYGYRSCIFPASRIGMDTRREDHDYELLKRMIAEFHQVEKYLLGDFYPLTSYSLTRDVWAAWQFDRPELGEGMVQAFRRDESPYASARFRLRGLDVEASYQVQDVDQPTALVVGGRELAETGLLVSLPQAHSSCLLLYRRLR